MVVGPAEILRRLREGKKAAEDIEEASTDLFETIRDILPLSRGGSGPDKDFITGEERFVFETADPIPLREVPETPSYALTQESAALDSPSAGFARAFERRRQREQEMNTMRTQDTIRNMVNDPNIMVTQDMLDLINDPGILMDAGFNLVRRQPFFADLESKPVRKRKKVSKYQKELGRQLKLLKKKHPRTPITKLMKKAHAATKKALKRSR